MTSASSPDQKPNGAFKLLAAFAEECQECGHSMEMHTWASVGNAGLCWTAACANMDRAEPVADEAEVHFKRCACDKFAPPLSEEK